MNFRIWRIGLPGSGLQNESCFRRADPLSRMDIEARLYRIQRGNVIPALPQIEA